jgi:hypothetical protein
MMENASTVSVANIKKKTAQNHRIYLDNFRGSRSKFLNRDSRSKSNGNRFNINKISLNIKFINKIFIKYLKNNYKI